MFPEEGRSAIAAAARAISEMPLGRIDEETTANVGTIAGGTAANVVPDLCSFVGEARSHDERKLAEQVQAMQDALTFAAGVSDCEVETKMTRTYTAYRFTRDDLPVRLAADALARCGFEPAYRLSGGAADSNVFNERGLQCVNLANGMSEIHTPDEYIAVADVEAMVEVTLALDRRGRRLSVAGESTCTLRCSRSFAARSVVRGSSRTAKTSSTARAAAGCSRSRTGFR